MGIRFGCQEQAVLFLRYRRDGLLEPLTVEVKGRLRNAPAGRRLLPNGNLLVPRRTDGSGGKLGHGVVELGPDDPEYAAWLTELGEERREA
jgi:hypothetical protein